MNEALPILSLTVSVVTIALLVPLYGKAFFSRQTVEYRPIEEIAAIRKGLGVEEPDPIEEAGERARGISERLFGLPTEKADAMQEFRPRRPFGKEKRPVHSLSGVDEAQAALDRDREQIS